MRTVQIDVLRPPSKNKFITDYRSERNYSTGWPPKNVQITRAQVFGSKITDLPEHAMNPKMTIWSKKVSS